MASQSVHIPSESDRSFLADSDDCLLETGSFADDDGFDADDLLRSPFFGDPKVSSRFNEDEEEEDDEGIVGENALTNMLDDEEDVSDVDLHSDLGEELDVLDDDDMICRGEEKNLQNSLSQDLMPFEAMRSPSRTQSASYTMSRTTTNQSNSRSHSFNEGTKSTNVAMTSFSPRIEENNVRRNVTPVAPVRTSSSHGRLPLPFPRIHEGTADLARPFQQDDKNTSTFLNQQDEIKLSNFSHSEQKMFSHSPRRASSGIASLGSVPNDGSIFYPSGLSGTAGSSTRGPFRSLSASAVIPALNMQDSKNLILQQAAQAGSSGSVDVMQLQHHQSQQQQMLLQQQQFQIQQQQLERQRQIQLQQEQAQQQQLQQEQLKLQQMQQMQQEQLKLQQLQQQQFQQEHMQQQHQLQQHILQQQQQQLQQQQLQQQQMHQQQMQQQQMQQHQIIQQAHMSPEQQIIQHQQQIQMQQIPMQQQAMQQQIALQQLNIQQQQQQLNQQQQEQQQHLSPKQHHEQLSVQQQQISMQQHQQQQMSFQQHSMQQLALHQQHQMQTNQLPPGPAQGLTQQQVSMQLPVQVQQQLQIQLSTHQQEVIKQNRPLGLSQTIHNGSFSLRPPQRANSLNSSAQPDSLKVQEGGDVIGSIPYFTSGNDSIGVLRSNSVSNAVSTDFVAPNAMLGSFESTGISGNPGAPTLNEAMEKLCDSMKRSAMSRSIIKQLSGSGLGQNSSLFLLAKQNSNHTLPTRQLSDVGLGVGNLLGDSSHRALDNERGNIGSIVHNASIARY